MRKIIEKQLKFGQTDINQIKLDLQSRDEIPQLLLGLQALYGDIQARKDVFKILESIVPDDKSKTTGRPGMDLWNILVLGLIRLNCNFDYDKLVEIANEHKTVREFLGHIDFDERYALQTVKDNVGLLTPEVVDRINQRAVNIGQELFGRKDKPLLGRCDSFVVETNVHYPTDINLLWDSIRKVITLVALEFSELGLTEWRQNEYILRKIKRLFRRVSKLKQSNSKFEYKKAEKQTEIIAAHQEYVDTVAAYIRRTRQSLAVLQNMGMGSVTRKVVIDQYIAHAQRQMDQICRRVMNDEKIPHGEKVFSIFEQHTEWISKGKAGVSQELGLKVCILEDQYGFILHHHVMEKQTDDQIAVEMVSAAKTKFPELTGCSFDKGFHRPSNQKELPEIIDNVVLPRKGRLSTEAESIENSEEFVRARRRHSAVESAINALENHALDRCPDHGLFGFKRYVSLAVLARNLQILGAKIQKKEQERLLREEKAATQRYRHAA
ncbi:MAG: ISNCY family transposase [Desulfobacteraceae bacterium]|nr:MAG: ISNCY family transposase [Desulfobacteraceae bacterium]